MQHHGFTPCPQPLGLPETDAVPYLCLCFSRAVWTVLLGGHKGRPCSVCMPAATAPAHVCRPEPFNLSLWIHPARERRLAAHLTTQLQLARLRVLRSGISRGSRCRCRIEAPVAVAAA